MDVIFFKWNLCSLGWKRRQWTLSFFSGQSSSDLGFSGVSTPLLLSLLHAQEYPVDLYSTAHVLLLITNKSKHKCWQSCATWQGKEGCCGKGLWTGGVESSLVWFLSQAQCEWSLTNCCHFVSYLESAEIIPQPWDNYWNEWWSFIALVWLQYVAFPKAAEGPLVLLGPSCRWKETEMASSPALLLLGKWQSQGREVRCFTASRV